MEETSQREPIALIENCARGCVASQEKIYKIIKNDVHSICKKYSKNHQEAEDVAQECFIRIFTKIGEYRGEGSFQGWVRRIAVNLSITEFHKRKKTRSHEDIDEDSSIQDDTFKKMDFGCSHEEIVQFINDLPRGYSEVLRLYFLEGYKHKEIAKILGITESTSKTQLLKARVSIRKNMEKKGYYFDF